MARDLSEAFTDRLRADLKRAMQARAREEAAVLRALIGAVDNAQSVPVDPAMKPSHVGTFGDRSNEVPRVRLSADDLRAILEKEIAERENAALEIERVGRQDRADMLRAETAIIARYRGL
jgi:uncharacterized protein YqeY